MSHQALARKYRPRTFSEATGQEHVSETLRRAVTGDRVAHAYLFCGPRGVGKTTLARVLAMALNCPDRTDDGEPCGICDSCSRIWSGNTALDVIEIDAASNRGVDDARDLRERAMYAPSEEGRYKVYIVDEAHMLTREAWNALLKILEEPPPRVIFVFATTEPQKIQQSAAPILSRCQRFDFRRIGVSDIAARLGEVLEREGTSAPEDALVTLARKADGGMRDGLSLLDQVLSLSGGEIDSEAVRRVLGLVAEERYLQLFVILTENRHGDVFGFVQELLDEGYDLVEFYHGLVDALRILLRLRLSPDAEIPELPEHLRDDFVSAGEGLAPGDLVRMLSLASELEATGSLRRSGHPRFLLEMLLLRLSYLDRTVRLEELLQGLGGAPQGDPLRAPDSPAPTPPEPRTTTRPEAESTPPSSPVDTVPAPTPAPPAEASDVSAQDANAPVGDAPTADAPDHGGTGGGTGGGLVQALREAMGEAGDGARVPAPGEDPTAGSAAAPGRDSAADATPTARGETPASAADAGPAGALGEGRVAADDAAGSPTSEADAPGEPDPQELPPFDTLDRAWEWLTSGAGRLGGGLGTLLAAAEVDEPEPAHVRIRIGPPASDRLRDPDALQMLEASMAKALGRSVRVSVAAPPGEVQGGRITQENVQEGRLRELIREEPLLEHAVQELDLELIE